MQRSVDAGLGRRESAQQGSALLITMLVLVLVSMLAVSGLDRSQEESTSGARLRSSTRTLHAADSGIRLAMSRVAQSPPKLDAFDMTLAGATVVRAGDAAGLPANPGTATVEAFRTVVDGYDVTIAAPEGGILVVNNYFLPFWSATVDGRPTALVPADGVQMALALPAGASQVRLRYTRPLLRDRLFGR